MDLIQSSNQPACQIPGQFETNRSTPEVRQRQTLRSLPGTFAICIHKSTFCYFCLYCCILYGHIPKFCSSPPLLFTIVRSNHPHALSSDIRRWAHANAGCHRGSPGRNAPNNSVTKARPASRAHHRRPSSSPKRTPQYIKMSNENGCRHRRLSTNSFLTAANHARTGAGSGSI